MRRDPLYPHVYHVSRDEVLGWVMDAVRRAGLTLEQFVERGRADELEGELRDMWMFYWPMVERH